MVSFIRDNIQRPLNKEKEPQKEKEKEREQREEERRENKGSRTQKELSQIQTIWKIVKGRQLRLPLLFDKWILPTGTYTLLAVSSRQFVYKQRETRQGGNEQRRMRQREEIGKGNKKG